ncbi:MAG: YhbY family RNA-binding protein [Gammaproteobacteria bacterium]|jgi:RNA-binding protein
MRLTDEQMNYLRILSHDLRPAIDIGAGGLTTFVLRQIDHALATQELVKVRVPFGDRHRRSQVLDKLAPKTEAALVQRANNAAVLYRPAAKPVIALPQSPAAGNSAG